MLAAVGLTFLECPGVFMSSSAVLPGKVPSIWVLIVAASSANLGLSILSPVITILRDDFWLLPIGRSLCLAPLCCRLRSAN